MLKPNVAPQASLDELNGVVQMYLSHHHQLPRQSDTSRRNNTPVIRSCQHKHDWTEGPWGGSRSPECLSAYKWTLKVHVNMSAHLKSKFQKLDHHTQIACWKADLQLSDIIDVFKERNQRVNVRNNKNRFHSGATLLLLLLKPSFKQFNFGFCCHQPSDDFMFGSYLLLQKDISC